MPGCESRDRSTTSCEVPGLLSGRWYALRIWERCLDARADSFVTELLTGGGCRTEAVSAEPPASVSASAPTYYSFKVSWVAGDPGACEFAGWDVQAKARRRERGSESESPGAPSGAWHCCQIRCFVWMWQGLVMTLIYLVVL